MERIKQALERARKERNTGAPAGASDKSRAAQSRPSQPIARGGPLKIEYTETRVIEVDLEDLREKRVITSGAPDHVTDAYRMLRTRVLQKLRDNSWKSLAITSAGIGEGKSLTAVNLAISLSMEVNHTVLLVDLDLRRPSIHKFFNYEPELGIADYLYSDVSLSKLLFTPSVERLVVLPGKDRHDNSSELLSTPRMMELVEDITSRYPERIVIFDMPPVLIVDDALAFSPFVDAFLLVIEEGETQTHELMEAREMLKNTNILGTVLNKAEKRQAYTYY